MHPYTHTTRVVHECTPHARHTHMTHVLQCTPTRTTQANEKCCARVQNMCYVRVGVHSCTTCVICVWRACRAALVHNMYIACMWLACRGALVHNMCVICVWRACSGAIVHNVYVVCMWRACRGHSCMSCVSCARGVRVGVHSCTACMSCSCGVRVGVHLWGRRKLEIPLRLGGSELLCVCVAGGCFEIPATALQVRFINFAKKDKALEKNGENSPP